MRNYRAKQVRRKALAQSAYVGRRAAPDVKPPADATGLPDRDINAQALKNQPKAPAFHTQTTNGGQFNAV
jgi:hypothetical protein